MTLENEHTSFVSKFRDATPYINAFRNKVFVLYFSDSLIVSDKFASFVRDLTLLRSLGIKLILVHGARGLIDEKLDHAKINTEFVNNLRVTDKEQMQLIKELYGTIRYDIEALFTRSISGSPQLLGKNSSSSLTIISGNFVTAQPVGIINGVNLQCTGKVRKIDVKQIEQLLVQNSIILLSPLGFSPSGETFNLDAEELATKCAIAVNADKLIFISSIQGLFDQNNNIITELNSDEIKTELLQNNIAESEKGLMQQVIYAAEAGVNKIQLINHDIDGALLIELFTNQGLGTLICNDQLEKICRASYEDINGLLSLIEPLEKNNIIVKRSRESIENEINNFFVIKRGNLIIACGGLYPSSCTEYGELVCLAVSSEYQHAGRANKLFNFICKQAKQMGIKKLFALTTQTSHWFIDRGFEKTDISQLPIEKQQSYNFRRNSEVYMLGLQ